MTDQEKDAQIGSAVGAYQLAKLACAHLDAKIDAIYAAYRTIGETMNRDRGTVRESQVVNGKLVIGYGGDFRAENLLNASELVDVLVERDKLREKMKQAGERMKSLGITDLR